MVVGGINDEKKQAKIKEEHNVEELISAKDQGISIVIDGRICSYINDFSFMCTVLSDSTYMRYYAPNDQGKIVQMHLDKVSRYK